jgi:hypothetical protein
MPEQAVAEAVTSTPPFDFMWLELTNQCNLQCTHCYADSGPQGEKPALSTFQFIELMTEAFALGCRRIQFIGGEPVLNKDLPLFIRTAAKMGFEFIEVYTNLTILPEELLQCLVDHGVHVATSVPRRPAASRDYPGGWQLGENHQESPARAESRSAGSRQHRRNGEQRRVHRFHRGFLARDGGAERGRGPDEAPRTRGRSLRNQ